jgi:hypothetical protein
MSTIQPLEGGSNTEGVEHASTLIGHTLIVDRHYDGHSILTQMIGDSLHELINVDNMLDDSQADNHIEFLLQRLSKNIPSNKCDSFAGVVLG